MKRYLLFAIIVAAFSVLNFRFDIQAYSQIGIFRGADLRNAQWSAIISDSSNQAKLTVSIDGREYNNSKDDIYMDENLRIMLPVSVVRDAFDCSSHLYDGNLLMVEKREDVLEFLLGADYYISNKEVIDHEGTFICRDDRLYIEMETLANALGYSYQWDVEQNMATAANTVTDASSILPYRYDLREKGRAPQVMDQGIYQTCWAFAALTALESSLMPEEQLKFSVDHMNENNSFTSPARDGGQYTMAMAYLAAWQGPVYEADDPYGDDATDSSLEAVRHVQEMQIIESKDLDRIKEAVFKYGGVESCIYTSMQSAYGSSSYYNHEKNAYCYVGEEKPNHDVVIIGWDDSYPKENFTVDLEGDGAFLCQNSWGTSFGEEGVFYVSYYDVNIGIHNLVYTGIEATDNYHTLYQSDLCGWVGQMGYNKESIYAANVFQAHTSEPLRAAGFYTTGKDTSYKVYAVPEFAGTDSLDKRILVAEGQFKNAGYHTVSLEQPVDLEAGKKFAVVIWLSTPNAQRPLAIEYAADELTENVDLTDGEGYVSAQGRSWTNTEEASKCNLCIKAYAGC